MSTYSIGDLARQTGVKIPTIRYYEKEGLLAEPVRTEGNQRRYGPQELERLTFIRHSRDLGLSMAAIRDLIELAAHPLAPCASANRIAEEQLAAIRSRIAQLRRLESELERITASCDGGHIVANCNVMKAFADHSFCDGEH
ncbi:MerR family transcriptional regulator [Roseibium litorale]|uniref:Helix-turn-helix domain-containing protein n=1 Tax=Roseibium litorale TaxID=2803841 RepID=A0ABR9CM32_9HYPH|nr:helix-turn-helix domain-containing protein [Roseibium litorale]